MGLVESFLVFWFFAEVSGASIVRRSGKLGVKCVVRWLSSFVVAACSKWMFRCLSVV